MKINHGLHPRSVIWSRAWCELSTTCLGTLDPLPLKTIWCLPNVLPIKGFPSLIRNPISLTSLSFQNCQGVPLLMTQPQNSTFPYCWLLEYPLSSFSNRTVILSVMFCLGLCTLSSFRIGCFPPLNPPSQGRQQEALDRNRSWLWVCCLLVLSQLPHTLRWKAPPTPTILLK